MVRDSTNSCVWQFELFGCIDLYEVGKEPGNQATGGLEVEF